MGIEIKNTDIEGIKIIQPFFYEDDRGFFTKTFEKDKFCECDIFLEPYEEVRSCSKKGTLRGLHFQYEKAQDKLIQVIHGEVYDVVVDLRKDSVTFGKWRGFYLSAKNRTMLYIPKGFAHGFLALEEGTLMNYICGDKYYSNYDSGIVWNDEELSIEWPIHNVDKVIISDKDNNLQCFSEFKEKYIGL